MGRSYLFECPKCAYKATVSGGADEGLDCSVQTIACRDCRRLFDAVTRLRTLNPAPTPEPGMEEPVPQPAPPAFDQLVRQLPLPTSRPFAWVTFPLQCPVSRMHHVESWSNPGRCPTCGSFLEKEGLPFRIWG